jgi:hypothetical protein
MMPRPCQRFRLESGFKLDLNWLIRHRVIVPGCAFTRPPGITFTWTNSRTGEQIATADILFDMRGEVCGWLWIEMGNLKQGIVLNAQPRHFGGRQWYFVCPYMNRRASVLWMPSGARNFACRQEWGRQVAYASQFLNRDNRAHRGQAKIRTRLCSIGGFAPEEWEFPPKPKWMRTKTYRRAEAKFDRYDSVLNSGIFELAARFGMKL